MIRYSKKIAVLLLINFVIYTFYPTIAKALTAGPTAPEYTGFEPVDATGMVDLITGDFSYTLPLIEIPGPEGGYPLSLSYHAGIGPGQESSWVGLGWSLNAGAINREAVKLPDDYNNTDISKQDYWVGGSTNYSNIGVSIPIKCIQIGIGISSLKDTYRGHSIDLSQFSVSCGIPNTGLGVSMGYTYNSLSNTSSTYVGLSYSGTNEDIFWNTSLGLSYNFTDKKLSGNAGVSSQKGHIQFYNVNNSGYTSLLGYNASSGSSLTSDYKAWGFSIYLFSFNHVHIDYSIDTHEILSQYGSLYFTEPVNTSKLNITAQISDAFALSSSNSSEIIEEQLGGTYPAFDNYSVAAQGLAGSFEPFFSGPKTVYGTNLPHPQDAFPDRGESGSNKNWDEIEYVKPKKENSNNPVDCSFRFKGEFSNTFTYDSEGQFTVDDITFSKLPNETPYYKKQLNIDQKTGNSILGNKKLASGKNIEWFTNSQILSGEAAKKGFIAYTEDISVYQKTEQSQIGGYMITNENGITYHFSLPVYVKEVYTRTIQDFFISGTGTNMFKASLNNSPYAYMWLLTAITGPDYVDDFNITEDGAEFGPSTKDWGYWVKFKYGKWASDYRWRNPEIGWTKQKEQGIRMFTSGKKELYYLDAIYTRSNTAIFAKSEKIDGKGLAYFPDNNDPDNNKYNSKNNDIFDSQTTFDPYIYNENPDKANIRYTATSSLKLDKIYLFDNKNLPISSKSPSDFINSTKKISSKSIILSENLNGQSGNKLLSEVFSNSSLRTIMFSYSNDLCPNTSNSFNSDNTIKKNGKLTLNSINYWGLKSEKIGPPITFEYDIPKVEFTVSLSWNVLNQTFLTTNDGNVKKGDIIEIDTHYYVIALSDLTNNKVQVQSLYANNIIPLWKSFKAFVTKNPPFNKDAYDIWGYYKPDLPFDLISQGEVVNRNTTEISAKCADVWSLRKINTALGSSINIGYIPDSYKNDVYRNPISFPIESVIYHSNPDNYEIKLNVGNIDVREYLKHIDFSSAELNYTYVNSDKSLCLFENQCGSRHDNVGFLAATSNSIIINDKNISDILEYIPGRLYFLAVKGAILFHEKQEERFGGGISVNTITVQDQNTNIIHKTNYFYDNGTTSSVPLQSNYTINNKEKSYLEGPSECKEECDIKLKEFIQNNRACYNKELEEISQFIPAPNVMYQNVKVYSSVKNQNQPEVEVPGFTKFTFNVFDKSMVQIIRKPANTIYPLKTQIVNIKDKTSKIGSISSITKYFDHTENQKIEETTNTYLDDETQLSNNYHNQGLIEQLFLDKVWITRSKDGKIIKPDLGMCSQIKKQTIITPKISSTYTKYIYNPATHVSSPMESSTSKILSFDFLNGLPNATLTNDSHDNYYLDVVDYAYHHYSHMGSKSLNDNDLNMLSSLAASFKYKLSSKPVNNNCYPDSIISAVINRWIPTGNGKSMYNDASFAFTGVQNKATNSAFRTSDFNDSFMKSLYFSSFLENGVLNTVYGIKAMFQSEYYNQDWSFWTKASSIETSIWKKKGEITAMNNYSHILESKDLNGVYSSCLLDSNQSNTIAYASNAKKGEIAYCNFESFEFGGNSQGNMKVSTPNPWVINISNPYVCCSKLKQHTGNVSLRVLSGDGCTYTNEYNSVSIDDLNPSKAYVASVWVFASKDDEFDEASLYFKTSRANINIKFGEVSISNTDKNFKKSGAGLWHRLELTIPPGVAQNGDKIIIGCKRKTMAADQTHAVYFDDFRVQPLQSDMSTYVYDVYGRVIYTLNNDNLYTKYSYDNAGKLSAVFKEIFGPQKEVLVSQSKINYGRKN